MDINKLTGIVVGAAIEVHKELGPGLLESTYEYCLLHELRENNIEVLHQVKLPVTYKGNKIDAGYRLDILIPGQLIIEIKAVDRLHPVHTAQTLTYMKLANIKHGLLMNFNILRLVDGLKRLVL